MTVLPVYLPKELKARLELVARREGRSEADLIREALTEALDTGGRILEFAPRA